jgi:DNA repair exonuclease SbcCD ATPase subunit
MDEFKEEYAKKLSTQNYQMNELKTAFLECQQKLEEFEEKLNGIEEEKQQRQMPLAAASMPPTKSLMDFTISDETVWCNFLINFRLTSKIH